MELASILILTGIVCLAAGLCLPLLYALRIWVQSRSHAPQARARLAGATGAVSGMGSR
jgi:hypothetical protein